jgi:hypothetical protein
MAKLIGDIKFTGRLGGLSFFPDKNGNIIVRGPGGPSKEQVAHSDRFENTRRNNKEFGRASSTGKLLRDAIPVITKYCSYPDLNIDLVKTLKKVIKTDTAHGWGERLVSGGNVQLLEDFQWNQNVPLESAINTECAGLIDPVSGKMQVIIASFNPKEAINAPANATHYQLTAAGLAIHPEQKTKKAEIVTGPLSSLKGSAVKSLTLDIALDAAGFSFLMLGLAITFFETVNGKKRPMEGGSFQVLKVDKLALGEQKSAVVKDETSEPTQPVLQQSLFG